MTITLVDWQRHALAVEGIDPAVVERLLAPSPAEVAPVGDPTLGGDGLRLAVDADCPHCGWPERYFDTITRTFGCLKCSYTSDERNA